MTGLNPSEFLFPFFALILGMIIGSFLNVVIYRVPLGRSVVFPGSACPSCGAPIRPMDNIPLISYLLLGGKCRNCKAGIPVSYPAVEVLTGIVFAVIVRRSEAEWTALLELAFAATLIALIFIDARHQLLPNVITYPLFLFALVASALRSGWGAPIVYAFDLSFIFVAPETGFPVIRAAVIGGLLPALAVPGFLLIDKLDLLLFNKYIEWEEMNEDEAAAEDPDAERRYDRTILIVMLLGLACGLAWTIATLTLGHEHQTAFENAYDGLLRASAGAFVAGLLTWWIRAVYFYVRGFEGMGLGDVKLMAAIGAFLGWQGAFSALLIGSIIGAVIGGAMAFRNRTGLRTALPLGVFLGAAAIFVMLWMNRI